MHDYIAWETLLNRMGDPTKWTARAYAEITDKGDPKMLPESIEAVVTTLKCTTSPKQLLVTLGEKTLSFHGFYAQLRNLSKDRSENDLTVIQVVHAEPAWDNGSGMRDGNETICLELRNEERLESMRLREAVAIEAQRQLAEMRKAERGAQEAEEVKTMAAKIVPTLEQQLVGKRISMVGVEREALILVMDDDTKLRIPCSSIECGDLEVSLSV